MKEVMVEKLRQNLKSELSKLAQDILRDIEKNDTAETTMLLMMKFLEYKNIALHHYEMNNLQNAFDLTLKEFEKIIDEVVPEILENHLIK